MKRRKRKKMMTRRRKKMKIRRKQKTWKRRTWAQPTTSEILGYKISNQTVPYFSYKLDPYRRGKSYIYQILQNCVHVHKKKTRSFSLIALSP